MYYGCIYKITNKINNKIYVGQTSQWPPKKRFNSHRYDSRKSNTIISRAMRKYGIENFVFEVIYYAKKHEKLNELEYIYIENFKSIFPNGYNIAVVCNDTYKHSKKTIEKIKKIKNSHNHKKSSSEQGKRNRGRKLNNPSSKYMGVTFLKKYNTWTSFHGKKYLGNYNTETDAAISRDIYEVSIYKENSKLNFPENIDLYLQNKITVRKNSRGNTPRKNKKTNIDTIGIYYSKSKKLWVFDRKGFYSKSSKDLSIIEQYAKNPIKKSE